MGIGNMLGNTLKSGTGNITKAFLVFRNPRSIFEYDASGDIVTDENGRPKMKIDANTIQKVAKAEAKRLYSNMKTLNDNYSRNSATNNNDIAGTVELDDGTKVKLDAGERDYLMIEVQYNPSSVRISSMGGQELDYGGGKLGALGNDGSTDRNIPVHKTLTTTLIFDAMDPVDSFQNTSAMDLAKNAYKLIRQKEARSIKDRVDFLIGLNLRSEMQDMFFIYGNMMFHGQLTGVSAAYTMFNMDGNPCRAEVTIQITQYSDERYQVDLQEWNSKYKYFVQEHDGDVPDESDE